jgi:hypothetical protein
MTDNTSGTEKRPLPQDDLDRLEEMHQRLKETQAAWRNLLEGLGNLKKDQPTPEPIKKREP